MITGMYAKWVYVSDLEKSLAFYRDLLGLSIKFQNSGWVEFDIGEKTSFAILLKERGVVASEKMRIMFTTNNVQKAVDKLSQAGVILPKGIREESYGKLLTVQDPDGHWFELFEPHDY